MQKRKKIPDPSMSREKHKKLRDKCSEIVSDDVEVVFVSGIPYTASLTGREMKMNSIFHFNGRDYLVAFKIRDMYPQGIRGPGQC
jgi:predicted glutamine amidotransferase